VTPPRVPNLAIDEELKRKLLFTLLALAGVVGKARAPAGLGK